MSSIKVPVNLKLVGVEGIRRSILNEIEIISNRTLIEAKSEIRDSIAEIFKNGIYNSHEYSSIAPGGEFYGKMGIVSFLSDMDVIINYMVNDIKVFVRKNTLTVELTKGDFSKFSNLSVASFISEQGHRVRWLEWLLFSGTATVVQDYGFTPMFTGESRTGGGLMIKATGFSPSIQPFRIPGDIAGVDRSNWITRVFVNVQEQIENKIIEIILRRLR